jgi:S-DNA-T family DNA segregation ATPase FtsK/SpoIIIE
MTTPGGHVEEPDGEDVVFETEVLSDEENTALDRRMAEAHAVARREPTVVVRRAVGAAWRSGRARRMRSVLAYRVHQAPRDLARLVWFVVRGYGRWVSKAWTFIHLRRSTRGCPRGTGVG